MTSIIVPLAFQFDALPVRVIDRNGEPWFAATDVSSALGYRDATNLVRLLDEDEKGAHEVSTPGGPQSLIVISESGLFHAIFKSRSEVAARFRRWVTGEVLPAIRKTGGYAAQPLPLTPPEPTITIPMAEYVGLLQSKVRHLEGKPAKPRRPTLPLTEAEIAEMRRLKGLGLSGKEIARRLGRSAATVSMMTRETAHA